MAWCRQATSLYLSQCWSRSVSSLGHKQLNLRGAETEYPERRNTDAVALNPGTARLSSANSFYPLDARHQMETFLALLAFCAGNSPVTGEFPTQRPVTRSLDVFPDLRQEQWN